MCVHIKVFLGVIRGEIWFLHNDVGLILEKIDNIGSVLNILFFYLIFKMSLIILSIGILLFKYQTESLSTEIALK